MSDHATDDLVKLHVCGSRYFGNLAHETKDYAFRGIADVRRFDVKDSTSVLST